MQKTKAYLAIYNGDKNHPLENLDQDDFDVCYFDFAEFNQDLCAAIVAKTQSNVPVVVLDGQAQLPEYWLQRLYQPLLQDTEVSVCSALSCKVNELSPLLENDVFQGNVTELDQLIYLLQTPGIIFTDKINHQCFIVRHHSMLNNLQQAPFIACNNLLVQSQETDHLQLTDIRDIGDQKPLPAHPLANLQWRLKNYLNNPKPKNGYPLIDGKPIMLHINMGWGGGVYQWIDDYCRHENQYQHLILSSQGELYRHRHGESFQLHYHQTNGVVMRQFEMQAPIKATCIKHAEYKRMLDSIIAEFQVQQIVVSSLIGHSLECLRTHLPTLRVFHDYFPSWPSLIANLDKGNLTDADLQQAIEQTKNEPFGKIEKSEFLEWQKALHQCYQTDKVKLAAPSQSVVNNLRKIDAVTFDNMTVIPHAIAPFSPIKHENKENKIFQILVLGRINPAKGQLLLEDIIKELGKDYPFIFIGAGNEGKKYLNNPNISVIMDYDNTELEMLLQEFEPDVALITSQTSETFNFTLSELQQAGICTLSTKFGALKERIIDGKTGFLCDNSPEAFVDEIRELRKNPEQIQSIRKNLKKLKPFSFDDEINQYKKLLNKTRSSNYKLVTHKKTMDFAQNLLHENRENLRLSGLLKQTEETLDERTKWGQKLSKELKHAHTNIDLERQEAKHLKEVLRTETQRMNQEIGNLHIAFNQSQDKLKQTHKQLRQTKQELSSVYQSRSWRVTKPLRKFTTWARHKRNALKFRFVQIKTLPTRAFRSLKTRGFAGTLVVIKNKLVKKPPQQNTKKRVELTQNFEKITIKTVNNPTVSIIIPVYNHFEHSYNCLKSIAELTDNTTFEVIVVDDCSNDDTQELIKNISGITYQWQKQNGGFIESCNTGAKLATGKYLMFLNNDTVVYENWLDALIEVFDNYPDVGLVGSKLVYPDNQLQEAGGIVFSDASGWNYGRLGNPDEPQYNHVREVDYCSGASILIRKDLFEKLGRFDERYKPAYYEDTDLAFAVRNIGKKVYYQPASMITHFEGISSGTDLTQGMKKYQVVNQSKFKEKWASALSQQPKSGSDIELCRIHGQPKRILIFDACTPTPDQDSGSLRMVNLIKILKELDYHVIFMPENLSYNDSYTQDLQQLGVECIYTSHITNPIDYLKQNGQYLDAVLISRYYVAEPVMPFIREYCPKAQIIFDTVDLHYVRERRMAELANDTKLAKIAEQTRLKELAVAKACDITLVVSPYEVEVLAAELPELKVKVLTNIHQIYGCRKGFKERKDIMFIGGYQHTPNVDAVQWFVKDIFPLIEKELPDLKFHIIGSKAPKHIQALANSNDNIIYQGFIEDIEPVMDDIRIAVAPLRYGAGVKGKVNMSMSYGQPVVGTKVAVEGMFTVDEKDCLMAETSQEFAQQVIRLYQDEKLWNQISKGGLANVQNYFSFESAKKAIENILND